MTLSDQLAAGDVHRKADLILADARHALRLDIAIAEHPIKGTAEGGQTQVTIPIAESEHYQALVDRIRAILPTYYQGKELEEQQAQFDHEVARAAHVMATGSSKGLTYQGRTDNAGPNLYSPERMMLWFATLSHMEHRKPVEGQEKIGISVIAEELASSKGAQLLLDKFAKNVTTILATLGIDKNDCIIRWGQPGSHFWHLSKDAANGRPYDIINFDIKKTLLLGDMVQQVMVHELGHYLYDTKYPERLEKLNTQIMALQAKVNNGGMLSEDEQKTLVRANYERSLYHNIWNAAADNAVDHASHVVSAGDQPRYGYQLLPALLVNFITLRGQGSNIRHFQEKGPMTDQVLAEMGNDAGAQLRNLQGALYQISSFIHGQLDNPADKQAFLKRLPEVGIYTQLLQNAEHPRWSGEQCFWDLYDKCERIAHAIPDPRLMSDPAAWKAARDEAQQTRNQIHEEIFTYYALPLVEQQMDKQKSMQEMVDALAENGSQMPGEGIPINIPGTGGGMGTIPVFVPTSPGSTAPEKPGEGIGAGKSVGAHEKDGGNGENEHDPEALNGQGEKPSPKIGQLPSGTPKPSQAKGAGRATDAIATINLGDGRTLEQLKEDPLFEQAIEQAKDRLYRIMEHFAVPVKSISNDATEFLPSDDPAGRLSHDAVISYALSKTKELPRFFRDDVTSHIPPVGDLVFALDTSGSMGWGKGSNAEYVIKSTAILMLAIQRFNEERASEQLSHMGAYVLLWGNGKPTFLGKPYDAQQQDEILLKMDEVLARVFAGKSIDSLHGGTELKGTFKDILHEYAQHRPDSGAFTPAQARGPVLMLIGSDGAVYDMDSVPLSGILQAMPSLTVDSMLTDGADSNLHQALLSANRAEAYQAPVNVHMDTPQQILPSMLEWIENRAETFQTAVPWGAHYDTFTEGDVAEQAGEALRAFRDKSFAGRLAVSREKSDSPPTIKH